jgi:ribonuclease P/MRP protein subunit RPP40
MALPVDVIYLDFQKAFDKVPHERLLKKIKAHGVTGKVVEWVKSWLKDRKQRVVLNGKRSQWSKVKSGVPQGSVLGPLLFVIFINDIDRGVVCRLLKFADDTKLIGRVKTEEDITLMREDLCRLYNWSCEWQMLFNIQKCKVLHFGYGNPEANYEMGTHTLDVVEEERDLGVLIDTKLTFSTQCLKAVNSANATLGMIKRTFVSRDKDILLQLYKSLVRPKLEYCIQVWRPWLLKDINLLEKVQRRATRMISGLEKMKYEDRLSALGLTTLQTRRLRGDLIEAFKICRNFEDVDYQQFFRLSNTGLRGHSLKMYKERARLDIRKFSFSNRIVDEWNKLTEEIVQCRTVNNFKNKIDLNLNLTVANPTILTTLGERSDMLI